MPITKSLALAAAAATALAVPGAAGAAATAVPKVKAVAIEPGGKDVDGRLAVYFKTDHEIARKANGKSIDASAGLKKATESSVRTENPTKHCYMTYVKADSTKVGSSHEVHLLIQGKQTVRSAKVKANGRKSIGC